jgi:hypothetical protein
MYPLPPFMFPNPLWFPYLPHDLDVPPTLYSLMNSIANYGKPEKTKIKDLAKASRSTIFDFDYPLSSKVDKETFEINILNHFINRRIGNETFTSFQLELNSKLNELMPKYNILFDAISNWDLFKNGLTIEKIGNKEDINELESDTSANINTDSETKMRHSDLPQSNLQDINNESYVNIYEKNNGQNKSNSSSKNNTLQNNVNNYNETIKQSQTELAEQYIKFQNNVNSVYTMLYKDLDCLFYQLY